MMLDAYCILKLGTASSQEHFATSHNWPTGLLHESFYNLALHGIWDGKLQHKIASTPRLLRMQLRKWTAHDSKMAAGFGPGRAQHPFSSHFGG